MTPYVLSFKHTWIVPAVVVRVIDGDTVVVHMEVMPGLVLHEAHVRVQGINAPEMNTVPGRASYAVAQSLLLVNTLITITMNDTDKFGRVLGKITMPDGRDFGQVMIDGGHAVVYNP
jgi:endonuclease YncB( thermonuclease family)